MMAIGVWIIGIGVLLILLFVLVIAWEVSKIRQDQIFVLGMLTRVLRNVDPGWGKPMDDRNSEIRYMRLETRDGTITKTVERDGVS